jgi:lysophospholipid acyltransferase (LPLAT)-like uncharacterized protein
MTSNNKNYDLPTKLSGFLLFLFSDLVYRTCRFTISGEDKIKEVRESGNPVIVTSWHGKTMMMLGSLRKYFDPNNFTLFFPDDSSGKVLDEFVSRLGIEVTLLDLDGDASFEMSSKLLSVIRKIKSGRGSWIQPDGPKGPAYVVKPGLITIARMTGAAILPLGCYCRNAYHVPRWDRYTLPLPFSKIQIQIGKPIHVPKGMKDISEASRKVENTLNRLTFQAAANYYESK